MNAKRREPWYGLDGQYRSRSIASQSGNPIKRIIGLSVLLVLVFALIQQLSDVQKVERVGQAIGLFESGQRSPGNSAPPSGASTTSTPRTQAAPEQQRNAYAALDLNASEDPARSLQSVWQYLLRGAPTEIVQSLATRMFGELPAEVGDPSSVLSWLDQRKTELKDWTSQIQDQSESNQDETEVRNLESVIDSIDSLVDLLKANQETSDGRTDPKWFAFQLALDRTLVDHLKDGEVWLARDTIPALRLWQRVVHAQDLLKEGFFSSSQIPMVETLQLVSQTGSHFRGVPIRVRGTIARIDSELVHQSQGWTPVSFQAIWIRPEDSSSQPIVIYVQDRLAEVVSLQPDQLVEVAGFFAKRFAYRSQQGNEVAPALFAFVIAPSLEQSLAEPGDYTRWRRETERLATWQPPVNLDLAYEVLMKVIDETMQTLKPDPWKQDSSHLSQGVFRLLMESRRLENQLRLLSETERTWDCGNQLSIRRITGIAKSVRRYSIAELVKKDPTAQGLGALQRDGQKHFFELTIETNRSRETPAKFYCNEIPSQWESAIAPLQSEAEIRQPVVIDAIGRMDSDRMLEGFANTVSWKQTLQNQVESEKLLPPLSRSHQRLLSVGFDLRRLDQIDALQQSPKAIQPAELPGLFQLMGRSTEEMRADEVRFPLEPTTTIADAITKSLAGSKSSQKRPLLDWMQCNARVIRVTRIPVDDSAQRKWLGGNAYYQLDCMADVGNLSFQITTDSEPILYQKEYPVTCLVRELPEPLANIQSKGQSALIEDIFYPQTYVQIHGWFYRFWSYKTQEMSDRLGSKHRQIVPLLIPSRIELGVPPQESRGEGPTSIVAWGVTLAGVLAIWWIVRRQTNKKNKARTVLYPNRPRA